LRVGDRAFPEQGWSDLPHAFDQWVPQVLPLLIGSPGLAELWFYDGPYRALLESDGTWRWQITLIDGARRTRLEADGSRFARSLLRAASARAADGSTPASPWIAHIKRALATSEA
jgi:hypothetical protein